MSLIETEAIVLRTYKLAEADKIVICLTKQHGLIRGVARGARRLKSRFGASLEPFTLVTLSYFEKEGRELMSLRHADILQSYFGLARDPEIFGTLEYMAGLAIEFAPPHEPNNDLFRLTKACIASTFENSESLNDVARYFEVWILRLAGFLPDFRTCANCRRRTGREASSVFLTPEGAVRCGTCAGDAGISISEQIRAQLHTIQTIGPSAWVSTSAERPSTARIALAQLTRKLITRALERKPIGPYSILPQGMAAAQ